MKCATCGEECQGINCSIKCHNNWMRRRRYRRNKMKQYKPSRGVNDGRRYL